MIREEKYGEYVLIRNQLALEEIMSEKVSEQHDLNDPRFNTFTQEERDTFEQIFQAHVELIHQGK